eukprot:TRINITY_DN1087_c0_g1_i2.p2 TRINITY_DN1087_c0_g1~~TRINITY_DN1087_c0_g1_i2.p2  ORF type:complete len:309 (-),score=46.34 TRINITY_DN1087_c0_g1_i2:89-928(-)
MIAEINSKNGVKWTAARNPRFEGMTLREARKMLGGIPSTTYLPRRSFTAPSASNDDVEEFDSREEWPKCADRIGNILDQGHCGSCWAFAASEVASDRHCIATSGATNIQLSAQDMVSCDTGDYGCNGGYLDVSMQFLVDTGIRSEECVPYVSGDGSEPPCADGCTDSSVDDTFYHMSSAYDCAGEATIKSEIETLGPVDVGFYVYQDFFSYTSGVYQHTSGGLAGGHAVKIIGYGIEDGTPFWHVANSWGSTWGMDGFFRILRGSDHCSIESQCMTGAV